MRRAAAALSHPNIVLAHDADEIGGTHLLVMEYVEGATDLARLVKKDGPLPVERACDLIRQAALGLQHAHEMGFVHRDIKPANLLVNRDGDHLWITDFGLARCQGDANLTRTGDLLGQDPRHRCDGHGGGGEENDERVQRCDSLLVMGAVPAGGGGWMPPPAAPHPPGLRPGPRS